MTTGRGFLTYASLDGTKAHSFLGSSSTEPRHPQKFVFTPIRDPKKSPFSTTAFLNGAIWDFMSRACKRDSTSPKQVIDVLLTLGSNRYGLRSRSKTCFRTSRPK